MIRIINIETASSLCSVSVTGEGKTILYKDSSKPNSHSSYLAGMVNDLSAEMKSKPSAVAVSIGPGSYTGLRIGLSLAKGLAFRWDIPLIAVSTLKIIAAGYLQENKKPSSKTLLCPMMDARRNEVYMAVYDNNLKQIIIPMPAILDKINIAQLFSCEKYIVMGSGAEKASRFLTGPAFSFTKKTSLSAKAMTEISYEMYMRQEFADVAYQSPDYLKEFEAIKPKESIIYKGTRFDKSV